jgi:hypothetical protein
LSPFPVALAWGSSFIINAALLIVDTGPEFKDRLILNFIILPPYLFDYLKLFRYLFAMKTKQLAFYTAKNTKRTFKDFAPRIEHGHDLRKGKRKLQRPFDSNQALHITLRSSRAKGHWSFLRKRNQEQIDNVIKKYASLYAIQIFRSANVGNHLHILLSAKSKTNFQRFLKTITAMIPRLVTGARKGNPIGRFWDGLAYSKIVKWGRQFKSTANYVFKNTLEAFGVIPPRANARGHLKIDYIALFDG